MTQKIVSSLALVLDPAATKALTSDETNNLEAHEAFLLGMRHLNVRSIGRLEFVKKAQQAFEKAVNLDPNYASAYAGLGFAYWDQFDLEMGATEYKAKALELAEKSLALRENALALRLNARRYFAPTMRGTNSYSGKLHELAVAELRKAIALEPNNANALAELAYTLVFAGGRQVGPEPQGKADRGGKDA